MEKDHRLLSVSGAWNGDGTAIRVWFRPGERSHLVHVDLAGVWPGWTVAKFGIAVPRNLQLCRSAAGQRRLQ